MLGSYIMTRLWDTPPQKKTLTVMLLEVGTPCMAPRLRLWVRYSGYV